jgi:hypothetical protein
MVGDALCVLFDKPQSWTNALSVLKIENLISYDAENMSETILRNILPITKNSDFNLQKVSKSSLAAGNICNWVLAVVNIANLSNLIKQNRVELDMMRSQMAAQTNVVSITNTEHFGRMVVLRPSQGEDGCVYFMETRPSRQ